MHFGQTPPLSEYENKIRVGRFFVTVNKANDGHCHLIDLTGVRHQRAVNIVRWSPDGQLLASGDDESIIIIWKVVDAVETLL